MDNSENKQPEENTKDHKKTLCNRCLGELTGIKEEDLMKNDISGDDIGELFSHMEFSLMGAMTKVMEENPDMSIIYLEYIANDIKNIKTMLGIDSECDCCEHDSDDSDEDE